MKKILMFLLLGTMTLSLAACGNSDPGSTKNEQDSGIVIGDDPAAWGPGNDSVEIPNPFKDYETLEEAVSAVGFDFTVPDSIKGDEIRLIQVLGESSMIQAFYGEGESDILIRKEPGSGDISGDYNNYSQVSEKTVDGRIVTMKGENDLTMIALWEDGGYTYSISARDGLDTSDIVDLIAAVE